MVDIKLSELTEETNIASNDTIPFTDISATATRKVTLQNIAAAIGLDDLSNVTLTSLTSGDFLKYDGTNFVNTTLSASDITSGTFADARISESSVTQHEAALTITEAQISDLSHYTDENVDDRVNTLLVAGTNLTKTYDDVANTLTLDVTGTTSTEDVQDIVGGMVTGNTETLISVTYQDVDGTLDFVVNDDLSLYDNTTSGFITDYTVTNSDLTGLNISELNNDSGYITGITGENIGSLSDVTITTAGDNDILAYNSGTSTWINQTASEAGLITASSTDTLTNKTIDANNNTITNLALGAEVTGASTSLTDTADITYNADTDVSGNAWVLDEDTMTSNSATKVPTQQSVKAYVDSSSPDFYTENADGFVIDGGSTSNRTLTVSGGNVEFDGSGTIADGNLLTGNTLNNAFELNTNINISAAGDIGYNTANGDTSSLGNLGATEAIDWSTATHFEGTLDSNVTITHTNEVSGQKITLALAYDGTAQRTITWSDVDKWADGTAPTAPSAAGEVLIVTLFFLGTTCYGSYGVFS